MWEYYTSPAQRLLMWWEYRVNDVFHFRYTHFLIKLVRTRTRFVFHVKKLPWNSHRDAVFYPGLWVILLFLPGGLDNGFRRCCWRYLMGCWSLTGSVWPALVPRKRVLQLVTSGRRVFDYLAFHNFTYATWRRVSISLAGHQGREIQNEVKEDWSWIAMRLQLN